MRKPTLKDVAEAAGVHSATASRALNPDTRAAVNAEWLKAFPDAASRPARHTQQNDHLPANMLVQCDATAWAVG